MAIPQIIGLTALVLFSLYTVYTIRTENFWKSLQKTIALKWGKQVVADLYIGLFLFSYFLYLNEGDLLIGLIWLVPTLIFGNIVPLIYFVLHYDSLIAGFIQ